MDPHPTSPNPPRDARPAAAPTRPGRRTPTRNGPGEKSPAAETHGLRVPPHNLDAEASLLGSMLLARTARSEAFALGVKADHFYRPAHAHIFEAIESLDRRGEPVDVVTVADELSRAGLLETAGGLLGLTSLQIDVPSTSNAGRYTTIVLEMAQLRRLIAVAAEISDLAYNVPDDVTAAIDKAEELLLDVGASAVDPSATVDVADVIGIHIAELAALHRDGTPAGLRTGWIDLDERLPPLRPGDLVVVAARPSTGKTAFCLNWAGSVVDQGGISLFASLEMSRPQLLDRILAAEARVDMSRISDLSCQPGDWQHLNAAVGRLQARPGLHLDDTAGLSLLQIAGKARRVKAKTGGLDLLVVDYAELVGERRDDSEALRVSRIARGCKLLAKQLGCVVVLLSQVRRDVEYRQDKRPTMADLRASGELEAAADVIIALYRDEIYNPNTPDKGVAEAIVLKARQGRPGTATLAYLGHNVRFASMWRHDTA